MNKLMVLLSCAGEHHLDRDSRNEFVKDTPDDHRVLGRVFHAENVRQDKFRELTSFLFGVKRQERDDYFEELEDRFLELLRRGLVL